MKQCYKNLSGYKPEIWSSAETLFSIYQEHVPKMRRRGSFSTMFYEERLYAIFSHAAYRYTSPTPIERINEYSLDREISDENSVVFTTKECLGVNTRIVLAFRGTNPLKLNDIITDVFITFGREKETERFQLALKKIEHIMDIYPEIPIILCGHSLGGTQAIYLSKKYNLRTYAYNPAQGISMQYLEDINQHPQIRVHRVLSDPVSCIAGLENVSGTVLFPQVSETNMIKNHSLFNFLPPRELPSSILF
jgi:hypothetical protein